MPVFWASFEESGREADFWWQMMHEFFKDAEVLYANDRLLGCLDRCHGAIERGLKALCIEMGVLSGLELSHELYELAERCNILGKLGDVGASMIKKYSKLHYNAAYPEDIRHFKLLCAPDDVKMVYHTTKRILTCLGGYESYFRKQRECREADSVR